MVTRGRVQIEIQGSRGPTGPARGVEKGGAAGTTGGGSTIGGTAPYPPGAPVISLIELSWGATPPPAGRGRRCGTLPDTRRAEERTRIRAAISPRPARTQATATAGAAGPCRQDYFRCLETSLVISNMLTCFLPPNTFLSD